jgi:molecular chaperone HtpG
MAQKEVRKFDAEVGKILQLMIHSLYTNKDIFLRELISNASDACDKLRYLAVTQNELLATDPELKITISVEPAKREITITDNGIGMNRDDLIENLGTIARSGTEGFLKQVTGDSKKDIQLIGQFGVGFYSCFMVADEVSVTSRKAGEAQAYVWSSTGDGEFTVSEAEGDAPRGTSITLTLREDSLDFLDRFRIRHITTTYSDHIAIPISFVDEEGKAEVLNSASALWMRPKAEISDEQYQEFYHHVAHSPDTPWMTLHNRNEGTIEYTNLLFIPSRKPFDLFHPDRKQRVKLYVKRVFITEEGIDLVPAYLRFLQGVIDSEDLPLNISRETLQHNHIIEKIRKSVVKRVLSELKKKAASDPDAYAEFWENFGAVLKEGLCEAMESREPLLEVCRFYSVLKDKFISLDDYIASKKEGQEHIFYLTGDSIDKLKNSPQLEGFITRGIDVLLLTDTVDDFWVNVVPDYKGIELKSVTRSGIELDKIEGDDAEKAEAKNDTKNESEELGSLIEFIKTTLEGQIADARLSGKLTDSPVCLAVNEGAMDIRMERFLIDQKQLAGRSTKIFEINPKHAIIKSLAHDFATHGSTESAQDVVRVLFDQACIIEGEPISDTGAFSRRLSSFISKAIAA